jgi:NCS1 family nucleobase:cation symporter-1
VAAWQQPKIDPSGARRRRGGAVTNELAELLGTGGGSALQIEENGINVISETERKGLPRELFWPWFGANVSVLGLSYGSYILGFGISFWQAVVVGLIGIIFSFWLCGVIATAGKRGSAPTMVLSRAAYGVRG